MCNITHISVHEMVILRYRPSYRPIVLELSKIANEKKIAKGFTFRVEYKKYGVQKHWI